MKRNGSMVGRIAHTFALMSMVSWSVMPGGQLLAAPSGADVQAGSATINQTGNLTQITASNGAIINYSSFNIGAAETVQFIQPDAASRVLNRITGSDPTQIDGTLLSNGIVYIVNPAGVYFGNGALVNVGGIYTGAAQMTNADFLAGIDHFSDVSGNVVNRGTINGSLVALIGQHVANYGAINAPDGMVTLLAGDDVVITGRDRHFSVRITGMGAAAQRQVDSSAKAAVENHGSINAPGGKVVWGAGDVYAMGIFNSGSVKAATVEATATGSNAVIGGTIDATSSTGTGGEVAITANHVAVTGTIDASGHTGGGSIKIGGDVQGTGTLAHAQSTLITNSAYLLANAISGGKGGTVIVWSDGNTFFYGTIEANGTQGGGFVETSGHYLDTVGGSVVASGGTWLLDPFNTELGNFGGAGNSSGGSFDAGNPNTWTASASPSQVDVADVAASLDSGTDVTINTAGAGGDLGDITVSAAITKSAGTDATLTFNADNDIFVNAAISSSSNKLNVVLNASNDVTVSNTGSITSNDGIVVVTTTSGDQRYAGGAINAGAGDVTLNSGGTIDESVVDQVAKITTTGTLTMTAVGSIGNTAGGNINSDSTPLFDVDAAIVDISTAGSGSNISVKNQSAGPVQVNNLSVTNGFVRFDSVGQMILNDNAVVVGNSSPGAGFAWLVSDNGIDALNPGNLVITTGPSANLRIDSVGDVGSLANPLVLDTTGIFVLMDRGDFADNPGGSSSFYAENQRAGTTNIVSMMLDGGDARVIAPDNINISDFSADFDTSFLGAGNLTLESTGGNITAPSAITMNGGVADFTSAGDIGTSGAPINISGASGLSMIANAGAGNVFLTGDTLTGPLTNIDPATFGGLLIASANTNIDISSDGTDITFTLLQLPTTAGAFQLLTNSISGDIHILDNAIVVPMNAITDILSISADAGSIDLGSAAITAGSGTTQLFALGTGGNITVTNTGPHIINDAISATEGTGRAELTADGSIGSPGSPVEFQSTSEIVLDVNDDIFVKHDSATEITLLSLSVDPDQSLGTPVYSFENFFNESYGDGGLTHILSVNDGSVDSLLINDAETASTGTSYSFTAKTGNLYVDDNGTPDAPAGLDGAGDGGIFSGTGNVTLIAIAGSVLPESPRAALNIRTAADVTPHGPLVTLGANTSGTGGVNGSIGGDGSGDNFLDISGARRLLLDARDHMNIRGDGQPVELLDITLDPDGPFVGSPIYSMIGFDPATFSFDVTSDGTHLFINDITSTHVFTPEGPDATEGTSLGVRARTGDIHVTNIDLLLQGDDPLLPRSVTLRSDLGSILLQDDAIFIGPAGDAPGNGTVRLNAFNIIGEDTGFVNTTVKVTTEGLLEMYANNQGGATQAIGSGPADPDALDVAVGVLIAQAGINLAADTTFDDDIRQVQTANASGGIFVFDRDNDAQDLLVANVDTWDGDVDIRTAGLMGLSNNAIVAGNSAASTGNGNVTLFGNDGIIQETVNTTVNITALGDQVTLLGNGAIGSSATNGSIDIEAAMLAGQVATNTGGFFVRDIDTALADGLNLNAVTDAQLGAIPGIITSSGAISVSTVNDMALFGRIATTTASAVTLTASSITFDNAGAPDISAPTLGGILDTASITLLTDAVLLNTDTLIRTAPGSSGIVSFGEFSLGGQQATIDSTPGNNFDLTVNADSSIFFSDNIGSTDRLSSLTARTTAGSIFVQGNVFTSGGTQNYFGHVYIMIADAHFDDTGDSRTAGIHFHDLLDGFDTGFGLSITVQRDGAILDAAATDPEVPTISFAASVGTEQPLKWLRLNAYDADADGLFDNSGAGDIDGRSDIPTVATIVVANELADGSTDPNRNNPIQWIVNVEQDFSMGQNEKLTAIGSVTLNANTEGTLLTTDTGLRLSDLNADRLLTLNAANTAVVLLNTGRTLLAGGTGSPDTGILSPYDLNSNGLLDDFASDLALDFWARDGIHINNAASVSLDAPAGPSVIWYSQSAANISGTAGVGSTVSLGYFPFITRTSDLGVTVLDLIPLDLNLNVGTIYPPPFPKFDDSVRLALTRHEFMNQLLVMTRDAAGGERLRRILGNATFDDMGGRLGARSADTVLNRIREDMVPLVLHTYEALFFSQSVNPDGSVDSLPRFDQLRNTLSAGVAAYQQGTATNPADPVKFRTFFEQTGESPETLATLDALRELYMQMAQLGLTDREWSNALFAVTARITPQGVSPDLIVMAALGQPYPAVSAK